MLFKEYYKQANNDIQPNRELIGQIYAKAERKSKPVSAVIYKYGMAVAALLVLAVSVYSYPKIQEYSGVNDKKVIQSGNVEQNAALDIKKNIIAKEIAPAEPTAKEQSKNTAMQQSTQDKPEMKKSEAAEAELQPIAEAALQSNAESYAYTDEIAVNETTEEKIVYDTNTPALASGGSGGGGAAAKTEAADTGAVMRAYAGGGNSETVVWSSEQYKNYLGIDVEGGLKLPSDLKSTTGNVFHIVTNEGELENDLAAYSFSGGERMIMIETSKKIKLTPAVGVDVTTENINSYEVSYCRLSGEEYEIYLEKNGIYFRIYSRKTDKTELDEMIKSILTL